MDQDMDDGVLSSSSEGSDVSSTTLVAHSVYHLTRLVSLYQSDEEFYTEPPLPEQLLAARRSIARFSLPLAQVRLKQQRAEAALPLAKVVEVRKEMYKSLKVRLVPLVSVRRGRKERRD